jgi:hypothetical protein
MLGVGLHSYGFMDQAFGTLMTFIASQLVVMALGMLPLKYWGGSPGAGETSFRGPSRAVTNAERSNKAKIGDRQVTQQPTSVHP